MTQKKIQKYFTAIILQIKLQVPHVAHKWYSYEQLSIKDLN